MQFVDEYVDCFASWDVISYFHENQEAEARPSAIALDIGRRTSAVTPVLKTLAEKGVLAVDMESPEEPAYSYAASSDFKVRAERFLAATRDRTNRLSIVSKVLQKEAGRL